MTPPSSTVADIPQHWVAERPLGGVLLRGSVARCGLHDSSWSRVSVRLEVGRTTHTIEILSRVTALISFSGSLVEPTLVLICMFKVMLHACCGTFDPAAFWRFGFLLHAHGFRSARFLCGLETFASARNWRYAHSFVLEHGP